MDSEREFSVTESPTSEVTAEEGEVLRNFIETYEALLELWNPTNPVYLNKTKRNIALDKLLNIYIKINPRASCTDVSQKINTLRCNYRNELKKVLTSKRLGSEIVSEMEEQQEEEREVLLSIYDGDPAFKHLPPTTFQYKYGEDESPKSFLLEISWGASYPSEKPSVSMDTFYNKHVVQDVKERVVSQVNMEAEQYLGTAMTYTLFEFVKEKLEELLAGQPESYISDVTDSVDRITISGTQELESASKKSVKKEQLSKAQKRKQWDRVDGKGDKPRGWDWVDVVKHLSQTGSKQSPDSELLSTPLPPLSF